MLARCAVANGAVGVRIEGGVRIAAVRAAVDVPIVGLVKRAYAGFGPYITPTEAEIAEVAGAGAEIVAFDATARARPTGLSVAAVVAAIRRHGLVAMADCATAAEYRAAASAGADVVATTLCGYTDDTRGAVLPAIDLLEAAARAARLRSSKAASLRPATCAGRSMRARAPSSSAPRSAMSTRRCGASRRPPRSGARNSTRDEFGSPPAGPPG